MDFDEILEELGELGRFQITTYALICLPVLFSAANSLTYVFTAGVPNYRCLVPDCDNKIKPSYEEDWLPWAIPQDPYSKSLSYKPSLCTRYVKNTFYDNNGMCFKDAFSNVTETCSEWVFDSGERTIVNDWEITCLENQWMLSFVGSSHFAGIIVGSALFGVLADRYGRKNVFIFCILLMSVSGMAQVFSPNYVWFTILVFVNALGTSGVYPLAFIIGVELVGKKKREMTGIILNYFYAIGEALVALFAWITKDWVFLQLSASAPPILFAIYYWIIPESVRWLLAKEKNQKAKGIICKAAEMNKVTLSEGLLQSFNEESNKLKKIESKEDVHMWPMVKMMLRSRQLVLRFAIVYFIWTVDAFVYYGLSVNSTSMGGDKYLNFALVSLVEIPGYTLAWVCIHHFGRRASLVGSLLLCGLTCGFTLLVPEDLTWAITTLFLIGKLGITSAFGISYVHTAEMLPTVVRSAGVGSASTLARVGSILAPFVPLLGVYFKSLPMLLFGGVATAAGLLALKLPETLGKRLPESVEEAKRL